MASTSGSVSSTAYSNRKIIDHAARRAGFVPERISGEHLDVALDLLFSLTSEMVSAGYPLWTKQFTLGGIKIGSPDVSAPTGTVDIYHAYWRILNPYRGADTLSTGAGDTTLFGGQSNSDVTIAGPNPSVTVNFTTATEVDTVGVLLGGSSSITTSLNLLTSTDGVNFTAAQTLASTTYTPGLWVYFDLDPSITTQWLQIQYASANSWVLNQLNYGLANGQDIELGVLSADDYYNLPDKQFQGSQPNSVFFDRTYQFPTLRIWPTANSQAFYNGTVSMLTRRYIQDPGSLTNALEVPQRWYEATQWKLADRLFWELPDELRVPNEQGTSVVQVSLRQARQQAISQNVAMSDRIMWGEERTRGPIKLVPSTRGYTR